MSAEPAVEQSAPAAVDVVAAPAGPSENERGGDATVSAPRRRAPSPISTRPDPNRPFAFKRQSSGFTSFMNTIASPTSEVRTRPATPAESATRSTFFTGSTISDSPPSTSAPAFSTSPVTTLPPLEVSQASGLPGPLSLTDKFADRPKGEGTLELERVLGMWAARTPTSSTFPNLPPLPAVASTSTSSSSSAPLFGHAVVTAEPESLDLASATQAVPASSASSSFSSVFADFAQLAALQPTASASRDLLDLPRAPRRQRSKSEADIMSVDFSLGPVSFASAHDAVAPLPLDLNQRFLPSFSQPSQPPPLISFPPSMSTNGSAFRPPSAPSSYSASSSAPPQTSDALQLQQYDLALRAWPSVTRERTSGGPGYREAAFLDVSGSADRGRRARSQGLGHRRSAKSDDLTHLLSPTTIASFAQQLNEQQGAYTTSNGHLAPPGGAAAPANSPPALPSFSTGPSQGQSSHGHVQHQPQQHQVFFVPHGQNVPVPVAYLASIDPVTGQPVLRPAPQSHSQQQQHQHPAYQSQQQQQQQQQRAHPQYSPQSNALALAAAQAAQAHAASIAHATAAAAAAAALQYNGGNAGAERRPSSGRLSVASVEGAPYPHGVQRAPYSYRSPVLQGPQALPSPPVSQANGASPGAASSSAGRVGATRRSRSAAVAAAAAMKRDEQSPDGEEDGEEEDAEGEEDHEMRDDPYDEDEDDDDDAMAYDEGVRSEPSVRAPAVSKGRKKATTTGAKKSAKAGARGAAMTADEEDEFTKESRTTQATIDAAKRRRNANAVAKFVCELCGETFTRRYNLRGHQRAHKGEKPYKCSYDGCDKSFARAHDCKRHELLHLGVRKYHCSPCKRDFVRLDALHRHHRSEVGQACVKQLQAEGHAFDDKGAIVSPPSPASSRRAL